MIEFEPDPELEWEVDPDMDVEILFSSEGLFTPEEESDED